MDDLIMQLEDLDLDISTETFDWRQFQQIGIVLQILLNDLAIIGNRESLMRWVDKRLRQWLIFAQRDPEEMVPSELGNYLAAYQQIFGKAFEL
jgi:hypothetical protein